MIWNSLFGTEAVKSTFDQFKKAQTDFNEMLQVEAFDSKNVNDYASALDGLTFAQQESIVKSAELGEEQKKEIISRLKQTTTTNAATVSTEGNTIVNTKNSVSLNGLAASAKAAWASMSLLNKAMIVVGVISAVATVVGHFTEDLEEVKEKADNFATSMKALKDEANSNNSTLSRLKDEYYELSEGVSETGKNLHLTTDEYNRYKDIVSQISDIMPDLTTYYNEQGEAIGFAQGKLSNLNAEYDKYVQKQAIKFWVEGDEEGNTVSDVIEDFNNLGDFSWLSDVGREVKAIFPALADLSNDMPITDIIPLLEKMTKASKKQVVANLGYTAHNKDGTSDLSVASDFNKTEEAVLRDIFDITGKEVEKMTDEEFKYFQDEMRLTLQNYKEQINGKNQKIIDLIETAMKKEDEYLGLSPETRASLSNVLSNMSGEALEVLGISATEGVSETDILKIADSLLSNLSDEQFAEAFNNILDINFSDSDKTVKEIRQQIYDYMTYISEKLGMSIPDAYSLFGFNLLGYSADESNTINAASNKFGFSKKELEENFSMSEIQAAYEKVSVNGIHSVEDLSEALKKLQVQEKETFEDVWGKDSFKETREELLELAKAGELTSEALASDGYKDFISELEGIGISANEAKIEILSLLDATEKLSGASQGISGLENAYKEFKEKGYITAETIESIPEIFEKLKTYDFDVFKNIVGNPESGVDKIQTAFNELVTAYLKEQKLFVNLTEEDKSRFVSNLTEMGITNAEEVVDGVLTIKDNLKDLANEAETDVAKINNFLTYMGKEAVTSSNDLTECTWEEVEALMTATTYYGFSTDKIKEYVAHKIWANQNSIESSADVTQLLLVAKSAGIATEAIASYERAKELQKQGYGGGQAWVDSMQKSAYQEVLKDIESLYDFEVEMPEVEVKGLDKISSSETVEDFNWIETLISRIERNITNLGKTISATYKTWSERNSAIKSEYTELNKELQAQINAQKYYENKAAQVSLSESYKKKVRNGEISIESISNENLKEAIQKYQELWEASLEAKDAQEDIRASMVENFQTAFDLIQSEYDSKISEIEGRGSILDALIGQQEAKGHIVSKNYYEDLAKLANNEIALLTEEYNRLNNALNSSDIKEGTEMWYELKGEIYGIQEALIGARTELIEYYNKMHELDWSVFDKQREAIERVAEEAEFLIDLMSNEELFDSDTGSMTEYGTATMGLRVANYNTYMKEAQDAAEELAKVEKQIANNQLDGTSEQVIERKNELLELQRESILAAQGEMQAIKDLKNEYYDNLLDVLQKLIDKKKEALNAEKDLYSYQKNIAEKSQNINSLKKQLIAYEGDNTEETQAKVQKLQLELKNAESDLEETQYEKWLDDQNQMLDNLLADAQSWIEAALKNLETVITDAIGITNEHSGEIRKTLYQIASEYGYDMTDEMKAIWDSDGDIASIFEKGEFVSTEAKILTTLEGIADNIVKMVEKSDKEAVSNGSKGNNTTTSYTPPASTPATTPSTPAKSTSSSNNTSSNSNKKWGSWFVSKKDNTPDSRLNINTSIVD